MYSQNRSRVTDAENKHDHQRTKGGGITWETGIDTDILLHIK